MNLVMEWIARKPLLALILALAIALGLGIGSGGLKYDVTSEGLLVPGDLDVDYYQGVVETFGDDVVLSILIRCDDVFREDILLSVDRLTEASAAIDGVSRVVSLTTVSNLKGEEGLLNTDDLLIYIPSDPEELAQLRRDALGNQILIGEVVNEDGRTTALHLFLENRPDDPDFEARLLVEVEGLLDSERQRLGLTLEDGVLFYQVGKPYMKQKTLDLLASDLTFLGPVALLAILLLLQLFFRAFAAAVIPAITGLLSVAATLGIMGYLDFSVNPVSVVIPPLLVVIGATEDIHMIAEYEAGLRSKLEKNAAVRTMAVRSGLAILLTSLTTFVGFLTIAPNAIPMLREFGLAASLGIAVNFVLTVLLVPPILRFLKSPRAFLASEKESLGWLRDAVLTATTRHRAAVVIGSVVVMFVAAVGCLRMLVDTDYLRFFRPDSEVRQLYDQVSEHLAGAMNFLVIVDTGEVDGLKEPRFLADVALLSDHLATRFDKVLGYTDYIRKLNLEMNGGDPAFWRVPDSREMVAQYNLLLDLDDIDRFVDFDFKRTAILVRTKSLGSHEIMAMVGDIEEFAAANLSKDLDVTVTGETVLIAQFSNTISRSLVLNLGWILLSIFVFISLLFVSFKAGLLAMIPNILPALMTFGFMGWVGIPLSVSTFPVVIIALGIAVDDTIHFMVRFSKHMKESSDNDEVLIRTLRDELRPVCATSFALIVGFAVLTLGQFGSTREFGILSVVAIGSAFIADLFVTPVLLQTVPLISAWDLLKLEISDEVIASSPLFRGLKPGEVKRIALLGQLEEFGTDEYVIRQGDEGEDVLVFLRGSARVVVADKAAGKTLELRTIGPGGVIGEVGFFTKEKRSASIIATEPVETLHIDGSRLERVQRRFPKVAAKLYYNLSQLLGDRLSSVTETLAEEASA